MISYGDLFVYGSILFADIYVAYTLIRANKAITRYNGIMTRVETFLKRFEDDKTLRKTIRQILAPEIKKLHEIMDLAHVYGDPRVIAGIIENAFMNLLAHLGAKNLKELGYKKEDIARITMAKNGIQAAGNLAAEGAGLNGLIQQFLGGSGGKVAAVGPDGKPDLMGMAMNFFFGQMAPKQQGPTQGGSGGGTIG